MKLFVGTRELIVTNCYPYRYNNGKLVLKMDVAQENIRQDELKALLKDNTDDIICIKENGKQEIYSGFYRTLSITDTEKEILDSNGEVIGTHEIYFVEIECISEATFQNGRLRQKIADQNAIIANLEQRVTVQNEVINSQSESITLMEDVMLEQLMTVEDVVEGITTIEESEVEQHG